jgi:hypothetical protein
MAYVKAALIGMLTALVASIAVTSVQIWLTDVMMERELRAKIDAGVDGAHGSGGVGFYASGSDISLLPAVIVAVLAFTGVFVWLVRRQAQGAPRSRR